ncbi:type IV-A pilus assembly ATPase PilB [Acinetobacter stercoris]|uniref:Type II secretion system protein E n=1 Tax=Acinetobacter stercoris TaxID=2126983 RepID=A0A2U3MW49_9GAMM|nr:MULTISPECIES: type IV-A pilus assembly ATPase PilB [Acinetobacter]SPL69650.1 Type II secretion system protein E [Acinetobacter stercoris]
MQTGTIKLSGFTQRLVEHGHLSASQMQEAIAQSQKTKVDIVSYLIDHVRIKSLFIAEAIAQDFGMPLFDLDAFDPEQFPTNIVDPKLFLQHRVLPLVQRGQTLYLAIGDPTNIEAIDAIRFNSKLNIQPIICEQHKVLRLLEQYFNQSETLNFIEEELDIDIVNTDEEHEQEEPTEEEAPIVKYVNKLLIDAIRMGASDLHFEPYEKSYRVRYRIDGVLRQISTPPLQLAKRLAARLKVMSQMDISEKRLPQDGRIKMKLSKTKSIDFRVNSLPTSHGEKIVLRILDASSAKLGIDALGFEEDQKELFLNALKKPQGMLLITGPTGSGKTVSLYTGLNILNTENTNISTVEDPVEINLEGINQVNVNQKSGLDFSTALRAFLRQDPDVIMVGEIRDLETAEIAIKAAQTGHMVLSTLHTNSAPETLTRLRNMGISSFNLATSVNLIIAQRLVRRLCIQCKSPIEIPKPSLLEMGFTEADLATKDFKIFKPVGCAECREGYKGRIGIYEVMRITPEISRLIMEDGNAIQLAEMSRKLGFENLRRSGLKKVMKGETSLQEVNRVTNN